MKDITRLLCMVLLSFLVVTGCSRRDILDDYPVSGVEVRLDWSGMTEKFRKEFGLFSIRKTKKVEK